MSTQRVDEGEDYGGTRSAAWFYFDLIFFHFFYLDPDVFPTRYNVLVFTWFLVSRADLMFIQKRKVIFFIWVCFTTRCWFFFSKRMGAGVGCDFMGCCFAKIIRLDPLFISFLLSQSKPHRRSRLSSLARTPLVPRKHTRLPEVGYRAMKASCLLLSKKSTCHFLRSALVFSFWS